MKRVLFYTDTPLLGGALNQMLLLAKHLPKEKYAITVACPSHQNLNPWCQKLMEADVKIQRLKVFHKHDPRHFLYLKKILPGFDLMHMHVWNPASCRFGFLAASKIPLVITEHDPFPLDGLKRWLKNKLLKRVKRIIVASCAAKKNVLAQDPALEPIIRIVPNGIETAEWEKEAILQNRNEFRRTLYKALPNEKVVLCVAELQIHKGQKYLIEAMRALEIDWPNAKLALIGDGPAKKHYEKLAKPLGKKALFLSRHKEIPQFMAAADIFVLPSIREAFGLVILEAAMAGLPIVASNVGGIPEIIEDGKTGLLVKPGDAEALAKALRHILKNPVEAAELTRNAKDRVQTLFNAKTMAEKTAGVYDEIL